MCQKRLWIIVLRNLPTRDLQNLAVTSKPVKREIQSKYNDKRREAIQLLIELDITDKDTTYVGIS